MPNPPQVTIRLTPGKYSQLSDTDRDAIAAWLRDHDPRPRRGALDAIVWTCDPSHMTDARIDEPVEISIESGGNTFTTSAPPPNLSASAIEQLASGVIA